VVWLVVVNYFHQRNHWESYKQNVLVVGLLFRQDSCAIIIQQGDIETLMLDQLVINTPAVMMADISYPGHYQCEARISMAAAGSLSFTLHTFLTQQQGHFFVTLSLLRQIVILYTFWLRHHCH